MHGDAWDEDGNQTTCTDQRVQGSKVRWRDRRRESIVKQQIRREEEDRERRSVTPAAGRSQPVVCL